MEAGAARNLDTADGIGARYRFPELGGLAENVSQMDDSYLCMT